MLSVKKAISFSRRRRESVFSTQRRVCLSDIFIGGILLLFTEGRTSVPLLYVEEDGRLLLYTVDSVSNARIDRHGVPKEGPVVRV